MGQREAKQEEKEQTKAAHMFKRERKWVAESHVWATGSRSRKEASGERRWMLKAGKKKYEYVGRN
ncbi:hypothetical protein GN244_ATG14222 [Phytophthora infestans]|uniref:Uncharacterized protein n=1 Tax=Phytophthora infestans TaxID=4787 RepID=A0A833WQF7_PHYIN|nr:hypothetical protein GN244_ATG14222 [Phytophthora infestans]KAF4132503.1 hypothetical protein GN958_ATG18304 [Phytophthora infestans]